MPFSTVLYPELGPDFSGTATRFAVFSCMQWKNFDFEVTPLAAKHRFAVMFQKLDERLIHTLKKATIAGAMSPIKLVAVEENTLRLFLDSGVASSALPLIKNVWDTTVNGDLVQPWTVTFSDESEVISHHSDYKFCEDARLILESHTLGMEKYDMSTVNYSAYEVFSDEGFIQDLTIKHDLKRFGGQLVPGGPGHPDVNMILSETCSICDQEPMCVMTWMGHPTHNALIEYHLAKRIGFKPKM